MAEFNLLIGENSLELILIAILVFVLLWIATNIVYLFVRRKLSTKISKHNAMLTAYFVEIVLLGILTYVIILRGLGLNLSGIIASLGIITIALAFSSQQLVQNFIAGIILSLQKVMEIGDWVDVGPGTGIAKVRDITLMRIFVRDVNGKIHSISNSAVINSRIINYTDSGFTEVVIPINMPTTMELKTLENIAVNVAKTNPSILPNVSKKEEREIRKLLKVPRIKEMFAKNFNPEEFPPRLILKSIDHPKYLMEMRFWIRDVEKQHLIISDFLKNFDNEVSKLS